MPKHDINMFRAERTKTFAADTIHENTMVVYNSDKQYAFGEEHMTQNKIPDESFRKTKDKKKTRQQLYGFVQNLPNSTKEIHPPDFLGDSYNTTNT